MSAFEKIVYALYRWRMTEPSMYGWFHIMWVFILIAACALVCVFRKRITPRAIDITLVVWAIVLIILEAVKLVLYSFHTDGETVTWAFDWGRFPFQFCSSPLYIALPAGLLKRGSRAKEVLLSFLATFSLFAGLISMFFPSGMFSDFVYISIHTMVFHSSMVVVGIMLYVTKTVQTDFMTFVNGSAIFILLVCIAVVLNINLGHHTYFNMFYISPYEVTPLEVFNIIYEKVPYPVFLMLYIIAFTIATFVVFGTAKGTDSVIKRIKLKHAKQ